MVEDELLYPVKYSVIHAVCSSKIYDSFICFMIVLLDFLILFFYDVQGGIACHISSFLA